jgi:hypothetical protein
MTNEIDRRKEKPLGRVLRRSTGETHRYESSTVRMPSTKPMADIAIVFDTTGSMSDKIDGLIRIMVDFVGDLSSFNLDWRITCIPFGDLTVYGDKVVANLPWANERQKAEAMLQGMPRFSGGGNIGESSLEALMAAVNRDWRPNCVRCAVLLTDEPALTHRLRTADVLTELQRHELATFVLSPPIQYFQAFASQTSGTWYDVFRPRRPDELIQLLRHMAADVARTAEAVHRLAGGSVNRYRQLASRPEPPE